MPTNDLSTVQSYANSATSFEWGLLVVIYLYTAGISAGMFAVSSFATYIGGGQYRRLARLSALLAPWPLMLGLGMLVFDLGRPLRFWRLFTTIQITSPMSIGSWLLTLFTAVALLYLVLWLPRPLRNLIRLPSRVDALGHLSRWKPLDQRVVRMGRGILAAVGFALSLGVGMYTGVLLGAIPSRPFWNTPMVAQLFLFSALSSGAAFVLLVAALGGRLLDAEAMRHERHLLVSIDASLIVLEIFIIIPFFLHQVLNTWSSSVSINLVMGGPYTLAFWGGVVVLGLLVPLAIEGYELFPLILKEGAIKYSRQLGFVSASLVLVGGFLLRYVFVYAGQVSHFLPVLAR
ncbi:MAG: NrfD/PsrC family molybdoenzyme membrane anchor subunit [Caldilineaceae bacterium]